MNYAEIKDCDIANGDGVRVSLFVSGCPHHCKGCFNQVTWDFTYGQPFTNDTIDHILNLLSRDYIDGLTILGGEPLDEHNISDVLTLVKQVRKYMPDKTIWCYTGSIITMDDFALHRGISPADNYHNKKADLLILCDIVVDGPFIEELKNISLKFRGSSNQRVIDVAETLLQQRITLKEGT